MIQKLLNPAAKLEAKDKEVLVEQIKVQLGGLKKFSFGKQISAVSVSRERALSRGTFRDWECRRRGGGYG